MKTRNKKVSLLIASAIFVSPLLASADMSVGADGSVNMSSGNSSMSVGADGSVNMINGDSIGSEIKTNMPFLNDEQKAKIEAQKEKIGAIMKTLESDLKYIRENLTKENAEELKNKAEELKISYTEKLNNASDNKEEIKKIIENRFKIFFNNQFVIREQVKDIKVRTQNTIDSTKKMGEDAIMKAKEMGKEAMEKARDAGKDSLIKAKEMAKNAMEKAREMKKTENTQIREENKQIKKDLKSQYKTKFISQLKDKLDSIPAENLEKIITNVETKREIIANNIKLSSTTKEKYLAQIDALLEILKEKLNPTTSDELNIEELLNITQ